MSEKASLEFLLRKYTDEVKGLQVKLDEAKKRYTTVHDALELIRKDGYVGQERLFSQPKSDKYKDKSMTDVIIDIIKSNLHHETSAGEVYSALKKHGFQSGSSNLKRDVFTRLYRLRKKGKLICRTKKGIKKYYLPETKE